MQAAELSTSEPTNGKFATRSIPCNEPSLAQRTVDDRKQHLPSVRPPVLGVNQLVLVFASTRQTDCRRT